MYLKKLEIFGFKSFIDKTVLNFDSGITAIIGPNGCGKSNIFDSIRWVLGEQSSKAMRGSSMEDVIFNGTANKPALGFAEVSLTFSNESKMLPVEYSEVTVTRRLFRSGESEYLLNKTAVRLRDIQELFMGTGVGAEAYSLVEQGKVDLIVSARPEDRRVILDEASGITKYKAKKKEALSKLQSTENNLLRVNDIITEVKRQIASIERQANKARRYKDEFEKLKNAEIKMAKHELDQFANNKGSMSRVLEQLNNQQSQVSRELNELQNTLCEESKQLEDLEEKITDIKSQGMKLENQIDMDNRQIAFNKERIESFSTHQQRLGEQKEQLLTRCRTQQQKIEDLKVTLEGLDQKLQIVLQTLHTKRNNLTTIANTVSEAKESIQADEEKILDINTAQVKVKNELTEVMKQFQHALARKRRLELENTKVFSEKDQVDKKLTQLNGDIESVFGEINTLKTAQEAENAFLKGKENELVQIEQKIDEAEKTKLSLMSQKEFIEKLHVQYQDIPDPVVEGRLLTSHPPLEHHTGILGKVKDVSRKDDLYEIVCETKFIELDPQQLKARIDTIEQDIAGLAHNKEGIAAEISQKRQVIDTRDEDIHSREKTLSIYEAQKKDITEESNKLNEEIQLLASEVQEVGETLKNLKTREDELNGQLDTSNKELRWCQSNIKEKQDLIAHKAHEREETTVQIAQYEKEIESIHDKKRGDQENIKLFTDTMDSDLAEIKRITDEIAENQDKAQKLTEEITTIQSGITSVEAQRESLKELLKGHENSKNQKSQALDQIREKMGAFETEIGEIKEAMHQQQMKEQEISYSERGIKDRLQQTYKIDFDQLDFSSEEFSSAEAINPEELTREIERLKKRCDSYGSVNLVAIEEYEDLKQRFEFLTKQQSDLLEAKVSLHKTIQKINRTTRQMFMETFTKVSEEFRIYFRMLFGGGEAQLVLLDEENVLESGIEIIARPPGKKLQNISLLSGGEKSLTAIALIFGVFKVQPSPFCILDEIDAALDESNVGRFGYLLKDFAKIAQFIVITHNKKTISNADVMYGITMQQTGVSRIVSVKLSDEKQKRQPRGEPAGVA